MRVVNIIPTYNEKENIRQMLKVLANIALKNSQWKFLTLVVDDNSPDGTGKIVKNLIKRDKSVYLLQDSKKGLGNALLRGYEYALTKLKADIIIPNDCDFSWDPDKIPKLLAKIKQGSDVVIASRYGEGGQTKGWSRFRKLNHWISNIIFATHIAGIKEVKDHNGNFKAIRVKGVLDQIPLESLLKKTKIKGFAFQPYILYELSKVTQKFCEIPVVFRFRLKGEAKISRKYLKIYLKDTLEYIKLCLLIRLKRIVAAFKLIILRYC